MDDFDWANVDFEKFSRIVEEVKQIRGEIIDSAISLETHLNVIICKILFGSYGSKQAYLFRRFALPQNFGFYSKVCFLEDIVKDNKPPKAHLTKQWIEKLKNINTMRNFLAHGNQSSELPLKNQQEEPEITISLVKKGDYRDVKITKDEIEKITRDIRFCSQFVFDNLVKGEGVEGEGLKAYFG